MTKSQGGVRALDLGATLSPAQFQGRFDLWLRQHEAEKPFGKLRELEARIKAGEAKLAAAERRGVNPDDAAYRAAVGKLDGLKTERDALIRSASIPHFVMATVHNFLRASQDWKLPAGSRIEVRLPGVFDIAVDLATSEAPF